MDLSTPILGVRLWLWLYTFTTVIILISAVLYWQREHVKRVYYTLRFAERVVKVVIHYDSGMYKEFFRLVPDKKVFIVGNKAYRYDNEAVLKDVDFFSKKEKDKEYFKIGSKSYEVKEELNIQHKGKKYAEAHYRYNVPDPIDFSSIDDSSRIQFSAMQLKKFNEDDLFSKLLSMRETTTLVLIILVVVAFNTLVSLFLLAKTMGWLE